MNIFTWFFFRSPSADLAKIVSQELGEQEIEDMRENYSYGANNIRDGISIGAQQMTKTIVFYPEIMELPDMKCYLRLPASYPVMLLELKLERRPQTEIGFIKRNLKPDPVIEEIIQRAEGKILNKTPIQKIKNTNSDTDKTSESKIVDKDKISKQEESYNPLNKIIEVDPNLSWWEKVKAVKT